MTAWMKNVYKLASDRIKLDYRPQCTHGSLSYVEYIAQHGEIPKYSFAQHGEINKFGFTEHDKIH